MRDDSQSGPKELSHVVTCYNCQRESKPQTKTFYGTKPNERYTGNLPVKKEVPRKGADNKIYYETECYTHKFVMKFGNFCSVKCGLIWANNEIEKRRNYRNGPGSSINQENMSKLEIMKRELEKRFNKGDNKTKN